MACHFRVATRRREGRPARSAARHHPRRRRHAAAAAAVRRGDWRSRCAPTASRSRRRKALAAGIIDQIVDGDLLAGAIAFAKAKAAAREIRKTREIAADRRRWRRGLAGVRATCAQTLGKPGPRHRRPAAAVDAIEAGADAAVRRGLAPRARALRRLRRLDRVEGAAAPVLRRARGRQGARRAEGHAGERHHARGGRRRRHHGRRHRDGVRERRHSGAAQGGRRRGAAARPGDDPQELRVVAWRRAR